MKKKLLSVLLLGLTVLLCACGKEQQLPEDFDVDSNRLLVLALTSINQQLSDEHLTIYSQDSEYYLTEQDLGCSVEVFESLCAGSLTAREEAGTPVSVSGEVTYTVSGDKVTLTVPVEFSEHTVNYEYTFTPNERAEYNPNVSAYELTEAVVSTQYSMGEMMKMAGMNTLMGIGVVFVVLIFISFVISLFKYLPGSGARQQAKKEAPQAAGEGENPAPAATAPAAGDGDLMKDQELVAVITAAVCAAQGRTAGTGSDTLVVRSIKRASR